MRRTTDENFEVTFTAQLLERRERSLLVEYNGQRVFIPRSQVLREVTSAATVPATGRRSELTVPTWLYNAKFSSSNQKQQQQQGTTTSS